MPWTMRANDVLHMGKPRTWEAVLNCVRARQLPGANEDVLCQPHRCSSIRKAFYSNPGKLIKQPKGDGSASKKSERLLDCHD